METVSKDLLAFVPKSDPLPTEGVTVRAARMLLYVGERLAGVVESGAAAQAPVGASVSVSTQAQRLR